jgi:hypothetical protein
MNIEHGKKYRTRSGKEITILDLGGYDSDYPIIGIDDRRGLHKFTDDGYFVNRLFPHPMDLMSES